MSEIVSFEIFYGTVEIVETSERTPTGFRMGGYSIYRDRYGREVKRTENQWSVNVTCEPDQINMARAAGIRL